MNWQMWLLVGLLLIILVGLAWMAWLQNRAAAILRAELASVRDQITKSEKSLQNALQGQAEHYRGIIEYLREQIALTARERDAHAEAAASAREELDQAQRDSKRFAAILARKEKRDRPPPPPN